MVLISYKFKVGVLNVQRCKPKKKQVEYNQQILLFMSLKYTQSMIILGGPMVICYLINYEIH